MKKLPDQPRETGTPYEYTSEQNALIGDLARKMHGVGLFMVIIGALAIFGFVDGLVSSHPGRAMASTLIAVFFLTIGVWTLLAGREFRRIVETTGHDIEHTLGALAQLRRFYSLHFWLIVFWLVLVVLSILGLPGGLG